MAPKSAEFLDLYKQYSWSWNAVAFRFYSCSCQEVRFAESVRRELDGKREPTTRYVQDDALFCFFVTGLSAIESFFYGLYAIAAIIKPDDFPMEDDEDKRNAKPKETIKKFNKAFRGDSILTAFNRIRVRDPRDSNKCMDTREYKEWSDSRNILAHRAIPGRVFIARAGNAGSLSPDPDPEIPELGMVINETALVCHRRWLASVMTELMAAAEKFLSERLKAS
jgi:hypothetical protein